MTLVIPVSSPPLYSGGMHGKVSTKPLVFACSGCSFAGKLSDDLARRLDRNGDAEMSCLAGIGAKRPSFIVKLTNREVWVIDGCPIECARGVFEQTGHASAITRHIRLDETGAKKHQIPSGGVDIDGFATQLTEPADSRS